MCAASEIEIPPPSRNPSPSRQMLTSPPRPPRRRCLHSLSPRAMDERRLGPSICDVCKIIQMFYLPSMRIRPHYALNLSKESTQPPCHHLWVGLEPEDARRDCGEGDAHNARERRRRQFRQMKASNFHSHSSFLGLPSFALALVWALHPPNFEASYPLFHALFLRRLCIEGSI